MSSPSKTLKRPLTRTTTNTISAGCPPALYCIDASGEGAGFVTHESSSFFSLRGDFAVQLVGPP